MRCPSLVALAICPTLAAADVASDFQTAQWQWHETAPKSYSFMFQWTGAVVIAPRCAGALVKVVVKKGVPQTPFVAKGTARCAVGTSGSQAIGFTVPSNAEGLFSEMSRYILSPPVRAKVTARFDPATGMPLEYYVEKLDFQDNDEGFRISQLRLVK